MTQKTVAFFGASTGVGLGALKTCLAAGHSCIALCRNPAKLSAIFDLEKTPNLTIVQGNAHDIAAVSRCLKASETTLVDAIVSTIGGAFIWSKMTLDDAHVCEKGIETLLSALTTLRKSGVVGRPHITAFSTTGMSRFGRDTPVAVTPFYSIVLKVPHLDKRAMEDKLASSGEEYTVVRASLLTDGETEREIRVGIEDPAKGVETKAIGYTISREDAGKWVARNLVARREERFLNKTATITY
ncbi:NAD(P)-binding protein [Annulohypoxylon maeteangense]|uniref:NAD(P)-binding protein n=1 Tax=Annulohypoxylon maeteangense TaxID=1927788 RepID=UPI0020082027|nr:NAD(P)-binding protein [Annulohypoxylon maeteangense]KAI0885816.1 NAD(P)-binding protein [Annulohypoxylon maeteangense]